MGKRMLALAAILLAACQSVDTTQPGVVGVERKQSMMVSSTDMNRSAVRAYGQIMAEARRKGVLNRDPQQLERVRDIADGLIAQTGAFRADAPGWSWEVNVITSASVNAWCMPGGKIAVNTGLIEKLRATDDELAAVIGHEIAHALREHSRERASEKMAQSVGISVVGALLGAPGIAQSLSQALIDVTFNLPNSRTDEVEADRIGIELAARAGFDPRASVTLWEKMARESKSQPMQFLSTHPTHAARISELQADSAKVMPLYEAAIAKR